MQYRSAAPRRCASRVSRASCSQVGRVAGPGTGPGSEGPGRGATVAVLRGTNLRRGIPGPSSPCHRYRSSRRLERRDLRVDRDTSPLDAADLMRQLVYLPQASIFVAETQRVVVGGAVLALRPSVRAGGFVGTIDLLVVDPDHDADRVTDALLEDSSARRATRAAPSWKPPAGRPGGPRPLGGAGFAPAGPRIQRTVAAVGSTTRRTSSTLRRAARSRRPGHTPDPKESS